MKVVRAGVVRYVFGGFCLGMAMTAVACDKSSIEGSAEPAAAGTAAPEWAEKGGAPQATANDEPPKAEAAGGEEAAADKAPNEESPTDESPKAGTRVAASGEKAIPQKSIGEKSAPTKTAPEPDAPTVETKKAVYSGPNPCRSKKFSFSAVRSACDKGGVTEAKALMKSFTKKGKDQGKNWKCSTCHDSTKTYTNKPNAVAELKTVL